MKRASPSRTPDLYENFLIEIAAGRAKQKYDPYKATWINDVWKSDML